MGRERARLRFECDGHGDSLRAVVVPEDDGMPEYELPICGIKVGGRNGEAVVAEVKLYVGEIDLRTRHSGRVYAKGRGSTPCISSDVQFEPPQPRCMSFDYEVDVSGDPAHLKLEVFED